MRFAISTTASVVAVWSQSAWSHRISLPFGWYPQVVDPSDGG
ncbi:MAG TPA: hypothetical protein VGF80_10080 [Galbitalea sp.]